MPFRRARVAAITVLSASFLTGCTLFGGNEEPKDGDEPPPPPPPPTAGCTAIELRFTETSSPAFADPCTWDGQTPNATQDQIDQCLVDPGTLTGTQSNPGLAAIELRRNGNQVTASKTAQGEGPWVLTVDALDCNTPGTCGEIFDRAYYELIVDNPNQQHCADFGEVTLTIPLKE